MQTILHQPDVHTPHICNARASIFAEFALSMSESDAGRFVIGFKEKQHIVFTIASTSFPPHNRGAVRGAVRAESR